MTINSVPVIGLMLVVAHPYSFNKCAPLLQNRSKVSIPAPEDNRSEKTSSVMTKRYPVLYKQCGVKDSTLHGCQPKLWGEDKTVSDCICVCERVMICTFLRVVSYSIVEGTGMKENWNMTSLWWKWGALPSTEGPEGLFNCVCVCVHGSLDTSIPVPSQISSSKVSPIQLIAMVKPQSSPSSLSSLSWKVLELTWMVFGAQCILTKLPLCGPTHCGFDP